MKKGKSAGILILILAILAGLTYYTSLILSSTGTGENLGSHPLPGR